MAHRDDSRRRLGTRRQRVRHAALIELARAYAQIAGLPAASLPYSLVFLSTDGAVDGGFGAARFAQARSTRST